MDLVTTKTRVKIFVSNRGTILEEKVNSELEQLEKDGKIIDNIQTDISYSGATGYQAMATITYLEDIIDEMDPVGFNINFGIGEPNLDCPSE